MKINAFVLCLVSVLLTGCATADFYKVSGVSTGANYGPLDKDANVQVFLSGQAPEFETVGLVQVLAASAAHDDIEVIVGFAKEKARMIGANIIVLEGKVTLKSVNPGSMGTPDGKGGIIPGTASGSSTSEYPKYVFIAGRISAK